MVTGIIYMYTSPSEKIYIGQTINELKRRSCFLNDAQYSSKNSKIDKARKKYGPSNFRYEILFKEDFKNKKIAKNKLNELEIYYIKEHDSIKLGYNLDEGGKSASILKSGESRKKSSEKMKGRKRSEESKKKQSKTNKGKKKSDEFKKKMSEIHKGRIISKEQRIKQSISKSKAVIATCINTGEIMEFKSCKDANEYFKTTHVNACCNNKRKQSKGYMFKFKEV